MGNGVRESFEDILGQFTAPGGTQIPGIGDLPDIGVEPAPWATEAMSQLQAQQAQQDRIYGGGQDLRGGPMLSSGMTVGESIENRQMRTQPRFGVWTGKTQQNEMMRGWAESQQTPREAQMGILSLPDKGAVPFMPSEEQGGPGGMAGWWMRFKAKNFTATVEGAAEIYRKAGWEVEILPKDVEGNWLDEAGSGFGYNFALKRPHETKWKLMDPSAFEPIEDLTDIGTDIGMAIASFAAASTGVGALPVALAGTMSTAGRAAAMAAGRKAAWSAAREAYRATLTRGAAAGFVRAGATGAFRKQTTDLAIRAAARAAAKKAGKAAAKAEIKRFSAEMGKGGLKGLAARMGTAGAAGGAGGGAADIVRQTIGGVGMGLEEPGGMDARIERFALEVAISAGTEMTLGQLIRGMKPKFKGQYRELFDAQGKMPSNFYRTPGGGGGPPPRPGQGLLGGPGGGGEGRGPLSRVWDRLRGKGKAGDAEAAAAGERRPWDPNRDVMLDPGEELAAKYGMGGDSAEAYEFLRGQGEAARQAGYEGTYDVPETEPRPGGGGGDEEGRPWPSDPDITDVDFKSTGRRPPPDRPGGGAPEQPVATRRGGGTGDAVDTTRPLSAEGQAWTDLALEETRGIHATGETGLETSSTMRQGQRGILSEIENINGEITAAQNAAAGTKGKPAQTAARRVTKLETERQQLVDSLDTEGTRLLEQSEAELGREARQGSRALVGIEEEAGVLKGQLAEAGKARGKAHEGLPERARETKGLGMDELAELDRRVSNTRHLERALELNATAREKGPGGEALKEAFEEKASLEAALEKNKVPKTHAELEEAVGEQLPHEVEWGGKTFTSEREPPPKEFRLEEKEVAEAVKSKPSMKDHPQVKAELEVRRLEKRIETVERSKKRAQAKVERGAQAQRGREAEGPVKTRAPRTKQAPGEARKYQKARRRQELEKTRKEAETDEYLAGEGFTEEAVPVAERRKLIKAKRREVKDLQKTIDDNAPSIRDEPKAQIEKNVKTREAEGRLKEVREEIEALEGPPESKLSLERQKAYKDKEEGRTLTERQEKVIEESVDDIKLEGAQKYAKDKIAEEDALQAVQRQKDKVEQLKKKLEKQRKAGC